MSDFAGNRSPDAVITAAELADRRVPRDGRAISVLLEEHRSGAMAALRLQCTVIAAGGPGAA